MRQLTERFGDILALLKDQRTHVSEGARVLEAIISHCSELARQEPAGRLRDVAIQLRDRAITMYALSKTNVGAISEMLETTIADLEGSASY